MPEDFFVPGNFTTIKLWLRRTLVLHNIFGNVHRLNKMKLIN